MNTSVKLIFNELTAREINVQSITRSDGGTLLLFEYEGLLRAVSGTSPDLSNATGKDIADDKHASYVVAQRVGATLPATAQYISLVQAEAFLREHSMVVVKPADAAHGEGVSVGIDTTEKLQKAIEVAQGVSSKVLIQEQVAGSDLRVLVVGDSVVAVAERVPASIVGDGTQTIRALIESENNTNPLRGVNYEKPLNQVNIDRSAQFLGEDHIDAVIPARDEVVRVAGVANIGGGGTAINRTDQVPSELTEAAVAFAKTIGLFVCGVDFMYDASTRKGYFIEANVSPSFGLHVWPSEGEPINVAQKYVDILLAEYAKQA